MKSSALAIPEILYGSDKNLQAVQIQRDCVTLDKYEISHLKRLAIEEWPSMTLRVITIAAVR